MTANAEEHGPASCRRQDRAPSHVAPRGGTWPDVDNGGIAQRFVIGFATIRRYFSLASVGSGAGEFTLVISSVPRELSFSPMRVFP
jgi:hypothetical protein